jgi:membrane protease YdiL (CAAX protease family)
LLVPLIIFAASHYRQGAGGIIAALVLGGILSAFYLKFRDLLANITAHFLADFVLNVGLPLAAARLCANSMGRFAVGMSAQSSVL